MLQGCLDGAPRSLPALSARGTPSLASPLPPAALLLPLQVTKSTTNPDELGILANQLTSDYGQLAHQAKPAALTAENEEVSVGVLNGGHLLEAWREAWKQGVRVGSAAPTHLLPCPQIGSHIKNRVQELGHGCAALVTKAGALQCSPSDAYTKKELIECARRVSEKVPAHGCRRAGQRPRATGLAAPSRIPPGTCGEPDPEDRSAG